MPEVPVISPEIRSGSYLILVPCATPDALDDRIAHLYDARKYEEGSKVGSLGWISLSQARVDFEAEPYLISSSTGMCPDCKPMYRR